MKKCNRCKVEKNLNEFPIRKYKTGFVGTGYLCFECNRIINRNKMRKLRANNETRKKQREQEYIRRITFPEKEMYYRAKKRASSKGILFSISISDIFIPELCPILNIPLIIEKGGASDNSPSLDRIDSTKGYTPENIRVISRLANIMKAHATIEQLKLFSTNIINYISPCSV